MRARTKSCLTAPVPCRIERPPLESRRCPYEPVLNPPPDPSTIVGVRAARTLQPQRRSLLVDRELAGYSKSSFPFRSRLHLRQGLSGLIAMTVIRSSA